MAKAKVVSQAESNVATVLDALRARMQQDWASAADTMAQGRDAGEIMARDFTELLGLLGDKPAVEEFAAQARTRIAAFAVTHKAIAGDKEAYRNAYMRDVYNPVRSVKKILNDKELATVKMSIDGSVVVSAFKSKAVTDESVKARKAAIKAIAKCGADDTTRDLLIIALREQFPESKFRVSDSE